MRTGARAQVAGDFLRQGGAAPGTAHQERVLEAALGALLAPTLEEELAHAFLGEDGRRPARGARLSLPGVCGAAYQPRDKARDPLGML